MSKLELIEFIALAAIVFVGLIVLLVLAIKNGWIKKLTKTLNEAMYYADHNEVQGIYTLTLRYINAGGDLTTIGSGTIYYEYFD